MEIVHNTAIGSIIYNAGSFHRFNTNDRVLYHYTKFNELNELVKQTGAEVLALQSITERSCMVYLSNGRLYSIGNAVHGNLGLSTYDMVDRFRVVSSKYKVAQISCSKSHTLLLTIAGDIYACGNNSYCQLGLGNKTCNQYSVFRQIKKHKADYITCASCVSAYLLKGKLYVFGNNNQYQLGVSDECPTPTYVTSRVQKVSLYDTYSLILKGNNVLMSGICAASGRHIRHKTFKSFVKQPGITNIMATANGAFMVVDKTVIAIYQKSGSFGSYIHGFTGKFIFGNHINIQIYNEELSFMCQNDQGCYSEFTISASGAKFISGRVSTLSILKQHYLTLLLLVNKPLNKYKLKLPKLVVMNIIRYLLNATLKRGKLISMSKYI